MVAHPGGNCMQGPRWVWLAGKRNREWNVTACAALVFENVTPEVWGHIVAALGEDVATVADSGTAVQMGVKIAWNREPEAARLTIQCLDKPFIVSCAMVESHVKGMVQAGLLKADSGVA
jgi:hypothetical protein